MSKGRITPKALAALAILGAVFVAHHPALLNDFAWDDHYVVVDNPGIRSPADLPGLFIQSWANDASDPWASLENRGYYRPLAMATIAVNWWIAGPDPFHFHLTNLFIHFWASFLLFLLLHRILRLARDRGSSRFTANSFYLSLSLSLLFAVHPTNTEAVSLICYRNDLMAGLFVFAGLLAFCHGNTSKESGTGRMLVTGLALFAAGLLSKETAAAFPALLLVVDWSIGALNGRRLLRVHLPVVLVTGAYLALRFLVIEEGAFAFFQGLSPSLVPLMVCRVFFLYVRLVFLPHPLCPFYDHSILGGNLSILEPDIVAGASLLVVMVAVIVACRRRFPLVSGGLAFFLLALLPVSHILPFVVGAGERFLYVPLFGIGLALAGIVVVLPGTRFLKILFLTLFVVGLTGFSALTVMRSAEWKDSETILRATVRDFPSSISANLGMGRLLLDDERPGEAIDSFASVVRLAPKLSVGHGLLAVAHARSGDVRSARYTLMSAPPSGSGLPTAAQIARQEFMKKREFRLLSKVGL